MNHNRAPYFAQRRRRLLRRRLCSRCGADRVKRGKTLCAGCLAVMAIKDTPEPSEAQRKAQESRTRRLLRRLDLIDEARRAVQQELDRLTA